MLDKLQPQDKQQDSIFKLEKDMKKIRQCTLEGRLL